MQSADLELVDGAAAGAWIKPRLGGDFGAVTRQVPKGFEAYARIFHPATAFDPAADPAANGGSVRWAEVAKACSTTAHREMQWHAIVGLPEPENYIGAKWPGNNPMTGRMDLDDLDVLCKILAEYTADPARSFFGLCTIESWEESFTKEELTMHPLLRLPLGRNHIVLAGPLSAVDQLDNDGKANPMGASVTFTFRTQLDPVSETAPKPDPDSLEMKSRDAPSLIWPEDRSWLVASEVDFDSTLVGGTGELIAAIVGCSELEAWQVDPTDSLAAGADKINVVEANG